MDSSFNPLPLPLLAPRESFLTIIGFGLVSHLLFKRYEFETTVLLLLLLFLVPAALTTLLLPHFSNILTAAIASFSTYLSSLLLSIGIYRTAPYHPLAKYPGPFLNKISKFNMVYIAWTGKQHEYYAELHRKFGDIVRTGPNEVMIRDTSAILPLMGTTGWTKSPHWKARSLKTPIPPLIAIRDPQKHSHRRRTWARGFSSSAVKCYEDIVEKHVTHLLDTILSTTGPVDVTTVISYFAFDTMVEVAFGGYSTRMLQDGDKDGLWHLIEAGMKTATIIGHVPWITNFVKRIPGIGDDLKQLRKFGIERAAVRREEGSLIKDLFYYLAGEDGIEKQPIPFPDVISDGTLVVVAGSDTTATVLSALVYYLLERPSTYSRLQAEVDKFFPVGDRPTLRYRDEMHYLQACINEALRLSPPVMSGSPRSTCNPDPSKGKMLGTFYVPEGTTATINLRAVQRDPRNFWPFPDTFWPERWLIAQGLEKAPVDCGQLIHNTEAFIPFSFGPANCVGKPLAMLELRMTILHLIQRVEIEYAENYGRTWENDMEDYFVTRTGKLPVVFTPRKKA